MFEFKLGEVFTSAPINMISWITDFLVVEQGGQRVLYSASRSGGGVLAFDITGNMALVDQLSLSVVTALPAPATLELVTINGGTRLSVGGSNQNSLLTYQISTADLIGSLLRPSGGPVGVISAQEAVSSGGQSYFYAALTNSGAISAYQMAANGTLTSLQSLTLTAAIQGVNVAALQKVSLGNVTYLAAALPGEDRVAWLRIGTDGRLEVAGSIGADEGLSITDPSALGQISAHGATYLLVAAATSSTFAVIEVGANGSLTPRDHLGDTLDTRFQGVQAFDSFVVGGRSFVVLGGGDHGVELLEILPGGRLIRLAQMLDTAQTTMDGISAIRAVVTGSMVEIFVAGEGAGITRLSLDLTGLGVLRLGGSGHDSLTGGAGGDLLAGGSGNDQLFGGAGDDVLYDGAGADTLTGGAGQDLFVLSADGQRNVIMDYQVGIDRIDLSAWPMVYDLSQVTITSTATGARLSYRAEVLEVFSSNGQPLTLGSFANAMPFALWHLPMIPRDIEVIGTEGADVLSSAATGPVYFYGFGGDDRMIAAARPESFDGGAGRDQVDYTGATASVVVDLANPNNNSGFAAGDSFTSIEDISGSAYADQLYGDASGNFLRGYAGNDRLFGRAGNDTLYGGNGDDTLQGGLGADRLDGGAGRDLADYTDAPAGLRVDLASPSTNTGHAAGDSYFSVENLAGSAYADSLFGDAEANFILGYNGNDRLYGRDGADTLYGGNGDDTLQGGLGADRLDGGGGRDVADYTDATAAVRVDLTKPSRNVGFAAGDSYFSIEDIFGSAFSDGLTGDAAANYMLGYNGNDQLFGGAGNDTLYGGNGNDRLIGGAGSDRLDGGAGADRFVFDTALGPSNVDYLADYKPLDDTIELDDAIFTALALGALAPAAFTIGSAATNASHRIIYNQSAGQLFYDADGNGAGAQILFAKLVPGTALTFGEFVVV